MELTKNIKESQILKNVLIALIGTILLAVSSKIRIPFYPVPMTMQTFIVLAIGVTLGWRLGVATLALYLFEGIIGLPVFSGTPEKGIGFIYFTGPTMGYLIGFLFAAFFSGFFNYSKNMLTNFVKLAFSTSLIYIFGMLWLGHLIGWDKPIFGLGAQPFLLAELLKIILITLAIPKLKRIV
jgi:biotin transport system substrate-specific component